MMIRHKSLPELQDYVKNRRGIIIQERIGHNDVYADSYVQTVKV